jgi:hypothetical protein
VADCKAVLLTDQSPVEILTRHLALGHVGELDLAGDGRFARAVEDGQVAALARAACGHRNVDAGERQFRP